MRLPTSQRTRQHIGSWFAAWLPCHGRPPWRAPHRQLVPSAFHGFASRPGERRSRARASANLVKDWQSQEIGAGEQVLRPWSWSVVAARQIGGTSGRAGGLGKAGYAQSGLFHFRRRTSSGGKRRVISRATPRAPRALIGGDEARAFALDEAVHDEPRAGNGSVAHGLGQARARCDAEQEDALLRVKLGRDRLGAATGSGHARTMRRRKTRGNRPFSPSPALTDALRISRRECFTIGRVDTG